MSKRKAGKGSNTPNRKSSRKKKETTVAASPRTSDFSSPRDAFYQKLYWSVLGLAGILLIALALGSGINGDDEYQNDYSEKLVAYYSSFGEDKAALNVPKGNMHYYGGLFDILTGFTNKALGYEVRDLAYHRVRHVYNALFGLLALLFASLLAKEIGGWRAAIVALLFLYLSPRFFGHSLMNPKDIPFAAGNIMAIYFLYKWLKNAPEYKWTDLLGLAGGIAIALATRAGGLLLLGYVVLFAGIDFLIKYGFKGLTQNLRAMGQYALPGLAAMAAGYILAILFWPFALANPIAHPLEALTEFSKLGVRIRVLFAGENIMSDVTPWYYVLSWIYRTIPIYALIGGLAGLLAFIPLSKRYGVVPISLVYFTAVFPVAYVIYKDSTLHDGWRHLMFFYPSFVVGAALFWMWLESKLKNRNLQFALWGLVGLMMLESTLFIVRNPDYPYVYFNMLTGGIAGNYTEYETDYWGVTIRQALEKMEREGMISADMQDTIWIASSFSYNLAHELDPKFRGKVKTTYVRYNNRFERDWDYAIFPSRYVRAPQIESGAWPNSKTVATIDANGVPLTAIMKYPENYAYLGNEAIKQRNYNQAATYFQQELQQYPDNELAWLGLANAYLNTQQMNAAMQAADKAMEIAPQNVTAFYYKGLAQLNTGDVNGAANTFQQAIQVDEQYVIAYYYLAVIQQRQNNLASALNNAKRCIEINPGFKQAYELAATILDQMGNTQQAEQYRQAAAQLK